MGDRSGTEAPDEPPLAGRAFLIGLARAFAGAILFALPLFMTMEMWTLGSTMDELRLALFLALIFPVLGGLAYYAGFEESFDVRDFVLNALVAYAVAFIASAAMLALLAVFGPGMSAGEIVGKTAAPGGAREHRRDAGAQPARRAARRRARRSAGATPMAASCSSPPSAPCSWRSTWRRPRRSC